MIFADPPYFLSNGGSTCQNGERVDVSKGDWDKSRGLRADFKFTRAWLRGVKRALNPGGTLWVSGTHHSIHVVGYVLQKLGFRILNDIVWEKPNPPPNLACRYFTHSIETLIWAARGEDADHVFNYDLMRRINRGSQMQSVWRLNAPSLEEKARGRHPTQKPVALVTRCLLATTCEGDFVFDPFDAQVFLTARAPSGQAHTVHALADPATRQLAGLREARRDLVDLAAAVHEKTKLVSIDAEPPALARVKMKSSLVAKTWRTQVASVQSSLAMLYSVGVGSSPDSVNDSDCVLNGDCSGGTLTSKLDVPAPYFSMGLVKLVAKKSVMLSSSAVSGSLNYNAPASANSGRHPWRRS